MKKIVKNYKEEKNMTKEGNAMDWITNYKNYVLVSNEDEEETSIDDIEVKTEGTLPILFSTFDVETKEDLIEEVDIQVSYDLDSQRYIIDTNDGKKKGNFSIDASLDVFTEDLEASWQDLYEFFVGEARNRFYE